MCEDEFCTGQKKDGCGDCSGSREEEGGSDGGVEEQEGGGGVCGVGGKDALRAEGGKLGRPPPSFRHGWMEDWKSREYFARV